MNLLIIIVLMLTAVSLLRGTEWYRRNGRRVSATVTKIAELTQPIGIATKQPPYTQGASINVFIDPNNMKRYDLDLD